MSKLVLVPECVSAQVCHRKEGKLQIGQIQVMPGARETRLLMSVLEWEDWGGRNEYHQAPVDILGNLVRRDKGSNFGGCCTCREILFIMEAETRHRQ